MRSEALEAKSTKAHFEDLHTVLDPVEIFVYSFS